MPKAYANPGPSAYPGRAEGGLTWVSSVITMGGGLTSATAS